MEYQRVYIAKDNDGHNYVIPYEMKDEFEVLLEKSGYESCPEWEQFEAEFIEKFEQYSTGGDINNEEFYIKKA